MMFGRPLPEEFEDLELCLMLHVPPSALDDEDINSLELLRKYILFKAQKELIERRRAEQREKFLD